MMISGGCDDQGKCIKESKKAHIHRRIILSRALKQQLFDPDGYGGWRPLVFREEFRIPGWAVDLSFHTEDPSMRTLHNKPYITMADVNIGPIIEARS